jgi:acyl-CoA dehydrogenase
MSGTPDSSDALAPDWLSTYAHKLCADLPMFFAATEHDWASRVASAFAELPLCAKADACVRALRASGIFAQLVPAADGGIALGGHDPASLSVRALCLTREVLGFVNPMADSIFAVCGLGSFAIVKTLVFKGRAEFLRQVAAGERIGAFALTEPEAGTDIGSLASRAVPHDGGYALSGQKIYISNIGIADHYIVFANAAPELGKKGITAFMVQRGTTGVTEVLQATSDDHPLGRLEINDAWVPEAARISEIGHGMRLALGTLDTYRISVAAAACGMAARALREALAHVQRRRQFGKRLAEFQLTQAALADMQTELSAARLLTYRAAWLKDHGSSASGEVAEAKLFATEAAQRIIDRAVQLHGGSGVVSGAVVEHLYRSIRPLRIYEGTSEIQRLIVAAELLRE